MININGVEWKVLLVPPSHPGLHRSNMSFTLGTCDFNTKTIYITDDLKQEYLWKVLSHELTHAAMFSYDIILSYEQEEIVADLIATYGQEIGYITNSVFNRITEKRGKS